MKRFYIYLKAVVKSLSHIKFDGSYDDWARELLGHRGTGYLRSWLIAMEDLHGLEAGPITPEYLEKMERVINDAYADDLENGTYTHLNEVLDERIRDDAGEVDPPRQPEQQHEDNAHDGFSHPFPPFICPLPFRGWPGQARNRARLGCSWFCFASMPVGHP